MIFYLFIQLRSLGLDATQTIAFFSRFIKELPGCFVINAWSIRSFFICSSSLRSTFYASSCYTCHRSVFSFTPPAEPSPDFFFQLISTRKKKEGKKKRTNDPSAGGVGNTKMQMHSLLLDLYFFNLLLLEDALNKWTRSPPDNSSAICIVHFIRSDPHLEEFKLAEMISITWREDEECSCNNGHIRCQKNEIKLSSSLWCCH